MPKTELTADQLAMARSLCGIGWSLERVAGLIFCPRKGKQGIDPRTLKKALPDWKQIKAGRDAQVAESFFEQAKSGECFAATRWWSQTQMRMSAPSEAPQQSKEAKENPDAQPPALILQTVTPDGRPVHSIFGDRPHIIGDDDAARG
ncbi:MAG: hypothetical protein AAGE01_13940 [Pseudomonadota bacterium]